MKYSFEKIEDKKSYVWHTEGDTKTLIAITDNTEKAHFLATVANLYHEQIERLDESPSGSEAWVSVEDRLPENNNVVLVMIGNKFGPFQIAVGAFYKDKWGVVFDTDEKAGYYISDYVTYWQPLPQPPIK